MNAGFAARRQAQEDQTRRIEEVALAVKLALSPDWTPSSLVAYDPRVTSSGPTDAMQLSGPRASSHMSPHTSSRTVTRFAQNKPTEPWWWGKTATEKGRFVAVVPPQNHPLAAEWHARYTHRAIPADKPLPPHLASHPDAPQLPTQATTQTQTET